ncbi:uncharacterized protein LOC125178839, partial [Hyalella azteca]|uniref:Uncharacterized protein LOC125178839 n=1 Tax=Hyalella azteca TaxID=294128 RepID=A0A979FSC5_HYAAZ
MRNLHNAADAQRFTELTKALVELVQESGRFYALPQADVDAEVQNLNNEIEKAKTMDSQSIYYGCTRLVFSGKKAVRLLWKAKLAYENFSMDEDKVRRQAVFHALDVNMQETGRGKIFSYTKIFEAYEKVMVVTGVAGSGKTTLVKNIVLQFFISEQGAADYFRSFNQLIFYECMDRTSLTLNDVILQHYKDLCIELGKENVLLALLRLDVLFIIDGFDEVNNVSKNVVIEIFEMIWGSNCRVLITTRPHAVMKKLVPLLKNYDVSFTQYEILPLTKLADQLEFLRRYEKSYSDGTPTGEMTRSFESMNEDVRSQFCEPINLVHFCEMYKHFPEVISSWQTPKDIAPHKLRLYRELARTKLADFIDEDLDVLLNSLFAVVGAAALDLLSDNVSILPEAELIGIKEKCQVLPKGNNKVDPAVVLSVVLTEHKPIGLNKGSRYEFKHKSEQEMFAGHYIIQRIIGGSADPLYSILGVPKEKMSRLGEVLLYVVVALRRDSPRHLTRRWGELKEALQDASVTAEDVMDCVTHYRPVGAVAELVALVGDQKRWLVRNARHVAAVATMLRHARHPRYAQIYSVDVNMEAAALRGVLWKAFVAAARDVGVRIELSSPDRYDPHDDLLLPLHNSGVRLEWFSGCVGTSAGVAALAAVARGARLDIRMAAPLDLSTLRGKYGDLRVYTRPIPPPGPSSPAWPLPPSPLLCVEGADEVSWGAVAHTITSLAPPDKSSSVIPPGCKNRTGVPRFRKLRLPGSRLRAAELPPLMQALRDEGVRTGILGDTRAEVD